MVAQFDDEKPSLCQLYRWGLSTLLFSEQDDDEIVALYINDTIYLGQTGIDKAKEAGTVNGIIKRTTFKFMAEFDLDPKWAEYAAYPTLFTMTDYNAWTRGEPIG